MMRLQYSLILYTAFWLLSEIYCNSPANHDTGLSGISPRLISARKISQDDQSPGFQLYTRYCLSCHQADGAGVRGMFPPLAGNSKITGGSKDIIRIVLFGLQGPVEVNERDYNQVMPAQNYLNDKQIADILTYIRTTWGNKASPVKPEEVAAVRKQGK